MLRVDTERRFFLRTKVRSLAAPNVSIAGYTKNILLLYTFLMARKTLRKRKRNVRTNTPSIRGIVKLSLIFICINIAYLIILPLVTARFVPCLANRPFTSYANRECTVEGSLDQFMGLAITGMVVLTLAFLLTMRRYLKLPQFHDVKTWSKIPSRKVFIMEFLPLVVTALLMAISIVIFYFLFIPTAEAAVRNAPIILESVTKPLK